MKTSIQILYLEDSPRDAELIRDVLAADGLACAVVWVDAREKFEAALADERAFDLILCDYNLPGFDGMSALVLARERQPAAPVIIISGSLNEEQAVRCLHLGATDYLLKQRLDRLPSAVRRALTEAELHKARQVAEAMLHGQKQVIELIAAGAPLGESLTALVRLIETHSPGMLGSIQLLDEDGVHLRDGASPSLPPEYVAAIDGMSIGPSAGSCGTAAYSKEAVMVEDIATDPRWAEYKAVALPHGLRACWSTPIFDAQRRVFGTFAMYFRQPALLQPDHQRLIDIAAHTAAIAIGRHRTETALRESAERLRFAVQAFNIGLWDWDPRTNQVIYSREWKSQLGYEETEIRNEFSEWERLVHPYDLAGAHQRIQRYLARPEGAYEAEFRMRHKDGTWRWIYARGEFFRDASGEAVRMMGCHIDFTERKQAEQALLQFRMAMESSLDGIFLMDFETFRYLDVNETSCRMLSYTREELLGMRTMDTNVNITEADQRRRFEEAKALGSEHVMTASEELFVRRKDGSMFPVEVARRYVRVGEQEIVVGIARDITVRRHQEQRIARLSRVQAVASGINAAIVRIRDRRELFREACRIIVEHGRFTLGWIGVLDHATGKLMAVAQAGVPENSGAGSAFLNGSVGLVPAGAAEVALRVKHSATDNVIEDAPGLMDAEHEPDTLEVRRTAIGLGAKSVIVLPLIVERETFGILTLYAPERNFFDDDEIKLLNELAGNISFSLEFIAKEEKVDYLAYYDVLTGLANRSLFLERVALYMRSAISGRHKLALYLIDLERFKNINDSLGRPVGDALLRQVAQWLTRSAGDANLVARVGTDHFAVVLPEVKQEGEVTQVLEKTIQAFMEHPFRLNDAVFRIAAKVGVALFPDDGPDADTLFKNAEAALKKAKASGDRHLFYTQKMTDTVTVKLTLENQLRQALDNEEFVLHYQPKVNLRSGKLTSAEALIRWNDPRTGLVPPAQFIPILEETGLIYDVGRWALRKTIADYLRWRSAGLPAVRVAVNVSPLQLRSRGFLAEVELAVGIDAQAAAGLELEITESLIMEDVKHNIASLQAIRAMGVGIAIDDFGTGFSSLSYLAKLPVDTLKIDRSFVLDMTAGPTGLALVSTIINLAHSLKLKVVAEGVETEEQSRLLRLLDCDEMQGYLFSKPVPCEIFEIKFLAPPLI